MLDDRWMSFGCNSILKDCDAGSQSEGDRDSDVLVVRDVLGKGTEIVMFSW